MRAAAPERLQSEKESGPPERAPDDKPFDEMDETPADTVLKICSRRERRRQMPVVPGIRGNRHHRDQQQRGHSDARQPVKFRLAAPVDLRRFAIEPKQPFRYGSAGEIVNDLTCSNFVKTNEP